ncbi:MAG: RluA family pseudouridine synthase [Deltaproteobacteria bacterium]|nr:RluA family pseudouridine synthase [Deltaproteobacteria bacterium]
MRKGLAYTVPRTLEGCRLDRFLREAMPDLPAKSVRFAIEAGDVIVGREEGKKGRPLRAGDEVVVRKIAEREDWLPVPGNLPGASVLYADADVAVLGKPADSHTEPQRPMEKGTLAGFLRFHYPGVADISREPGLTLLTRLDYATSGAVPAALTPDAFAFLAREREKGRIVKTYACLVEGRLEKEMSLSYLLETAGGEKVKVRKERGEENPLHWTAVSPVRRAGERTLVRAVISKGKRHQIRAHLAAAGFPIVGDRRYGAVPPEGQGKCRLMLHAEEVRFSHPATGELLRVVAPLPAEFEAI